MVGREFLYRIMQSVTGAPDDLEDSLAGLSAADLIRERNNDADLEYIFKHALTQEVAYDGLLRRDRQLLHERVARGVEAQLGDRTEEFVETLAYHYQRSGHVVEAVDYLRRSGRKALDRYALAEAHRQYRAAYDLLTADDDDTNRGRPCNSGSAPDRDDPRVGAVPLLHVRHGRAPRPPGAPSRPTGGGGRRRAHRPLDRLGRAW